MEKEIYISIILEGKDLDVKKISELTNLYSSKSKDRIWIFSSRDYLESEDINDHVNWILDNVEPFLPEINVRFHVERLELSCYWYSKIHHGGPYFSIEVLRRIVRNNLSLWIDTYYD